MKRRLFTILSAISLVLFIATIILWGESYRIDIPLYDTGASQRVGGIQRIGGCRHGILWFSRRHVEAATPNIDDPYGGAASLSSYYTGWEALGLQYSCRYIAGWLNWHEALAISCFYPAIVTALLPILWTRGYARQRRTERCRRLGRCTTCGYDLTGNISGACPECGTPVAKRTCNDPAWRV